MRTKIGIGLAAAIWMAATTLPAQAVPVMPSFDNAPTGWVTDRFQPAGFADVGTVNGRNDVLGIDINQAQGYGSRPSGFNSTFYNTQGMQHPAAGGLGSTITTELYVPLSWSIDSLGSRRTDVWGVAEDATNAVSAYAIMGFTNYGGAARYRLWDEDVSGGWVDLSNPVVYDDWTKFTIELATTGEFNFYLNDTLVYSDFTTGGTTQFGDVIMQAYNFNGNDPNVPDAITRGDSGNYRALWANADVGTNAVPEPATLPVMLIGFVGLGIMLRRRKQSASA